MQILKEGTATLLIASNGAIWVALRDASKKLLPMHWESAGGAVKPGEQPIVAARREVLEETGLDIDERRFEYRGSILVNGWNVYLYLVDLRVNEVPRDVEVDAFVRGAWTLATVDVMLSIPNKTAALSALVAIMANECNPRRKVPYEETGTEY